MVLREALSKQNSPFVNLLSYAEDLMVDVPDLPSPQVTALSPRDYRPVRRLQTAEQAELVDLYRSGKNTYELAGQFKIHRVTVSRILKGAGVEMRNRGLTDGQIDEAVRLYAGGKSLARIGEYFGIDHGTVRRALKKRGVQMRDTHGRPV